MFRSISSRSFSHVRRINDVKNLAHATLNWETVTQDSLCKRFHEIFMLHVDPTMKTLLDPDSAIHPFSMASKVESEDYPSFKEIMRMSLEERAKWLDSMDEEIQALFKTSACKFADHADASFQWLD